MQSTVLFLGAGIAFFWGVGHLIPIRDVVSGFGNISDDNRRILMMEWIAEGLTLCFLGFLVALFALIFGPEQRATMLVARACAAMLVVLAGVSAFTGAKTSVLPMKLCPFVKSIAALLIISGTLA